MVAVSDYLTTGFQWNGSTSDIAQQLYRRSLDENARMLTKLTIETTPLPDEILSRLKGVDVTFGELPPLLQRALVWDSGFAISNQNQFVRVKTLHGISMAQIAVTETEYNNTAKCNLMTCTQEDGTTWSKNKEWRGVDMLQATLCVVEPFERAKNLNMSMWATGGVNTDIPTFRVFNHTWNDTGSHAVYEVAANHTREVDQEPNWGTCVINSDDLTKSSPGAMIIPCSTPNTISRTKMDQMAQPVPGKLVTAWLQDYKSKKTNSINMMYVVIPAILVLIIVLAGLLWCRRRRGRDESHDQDQLYIRVENSRCLRFPDPEVKRASRPSLGMSLSSRTTASSRPSDEQTRESIYNSAWQILQDDPSVSEKKLTYAQLELAEQVSKGAFGEVWVGYCSGQIVAIKRLHLTKNECPRAVETFALEIQLSANLHHPNIVRFIGAAWDNLDNLLMAMEYLPSGDLSKVLRTNGDQLTWKRHKLFMARGLFSAVAYLHAQTPAIIHRDLKSKNVLLSDALEPKVIDFGVSRRQIDETMTAAVGTPFWAAPEVLLGERYTEKSDMYSLGVLLTELDTHQTPYYDVKTAEGRPNPVAIIKDVIDGKLRPSVTADCPDHIHRIIVSCLRQDPTTRPTALEVLYKLA